MEGVSFRSILPHLAGNKSWTVVPVHQAGDALTRLMGDSDKLTDLTARDPRNVGVRGGYPQINTGLPGEEALLGRFVKFAYRRSAPARAIVDTISSFVWAEWVDVQTDDEALKAALETVFKNPTGRPGDRPLWWWVERAYRLARRDGRSLLHFTLEDNNAGNPALPPVNVRGIRGLNVIRQENIQEAIIGKDPSNPSEFGRVLGWRVRVNQAGALGAAGSTVVVHAQRVQPFIPYPTEDDPSNGESILAQNINYVEMLENMAWANAEAYFQEAAPFVVVILDKDVVLTEQERSDAKKQVAQMQQSLTQRVFLKGVRVEVLQGSGQLANPLPHFEVALRMFAMSMGGWPKSLMTGDSAGELSASREDSRRAQSIISKIQEQDADPIMNGIISRLIEWGVTGWAPVVAGPVELRWKPIFESDAKEEAERQVMLANARATYRNTGLPPPEDLVYDPAEWPEGTTFDVGGGSPFGLAPAAGRAIRGL